jgi:hypothetical protein
MATSYSRRSGDYIYDIETHEVSLPYATGGRFCARVVNMVRSESGQLVTVNVELEDEYGATRAEAVSQIEAIVQKWVKSQTPSD